MYKTYCTKNNHTLYWKILSILEGKDIIKKKTLLLYEIERNHENISFYCYIFFPDTI